MKAIPTTAPSPKPKRIILIRHGESEHNALPKEGGIVTNEASGSSILKLPDHKIPLSNEGRRQAVRTGEYLANQPDMKPDVIYHSHYTRTLETMELILQAFPSPHNFKIRGNPKLGERQSGYIYGWSREKIAEYFPWYQDYHDREGYFQARPPGGESQFDVVNRVYNFIGEMFRHRVGQTVWVVGHGGIIRAFRFWWENWSPDDYNADKNACNNCAITIYDSDPKQPGLTLERYNFTAWQPMH